MPILCSEAWVEVIAYINNIKDKQASETRLSPIGEYT